MNNINIVPADVIFILIILFFTVRCIIKGFVSELMAVASVTGGVIAGFLFSALLTEYAVLSLGLTWWNRLISFLVIFLAVYIVIKLLERFFYSIIEKINLERLDRSLGLFLGLLEGVVLVIFIVTIIDAQPFFPAERFFSGSIVAEIVRKIVVLMPEHKSVIPAI